MFELILELPIIYQFKPLFFAFTTKMLLGEQMYVSISCTLQFQLFTFHTSVEIYSNILNIRLRKSVKFASSNFEQKGNIIRNHFPFYLNKNLGEKPYKCNQCLAMFAQKGSLTRHRRSHAGFQSKRFLLSIINLGENLQLCFNKQNCI